MTIHGWPPSLGFAWQMMMQTRVMYLPHSWKTSLDAIQAKLYGAPFLEEHFLIGKPSAQRGPIVHRLHPQLNSLNLLPAI